MTLYDQTTIMCNSATDTCTEGNAYLYHSKLICQYYKKMLQYSFN